MTSAQLPEIRGPHRLGRVAAAVVGFGCAYGGLAFVSTLGSGVPAATPLSAADLRQAAARVVKINEVMYNPPVAGAEADSEWLELYNAGGEPADLGGWTVEDNRAARQIPAVLVPPGGFVILAGGGGFRAQYPAYAGLLVELDGAIGNGLGNAGDEVRLVDPSGAAVDGMSYGGDAAVLDPPVALVDTGHSVERVPAGLDTDSALDWVDQVQPSPGEQAFSPPTPTATLEPPSSPTTTGPPTADGPRLNELLPAPRVVDWNGDGLVDSGDEWVEITNRGDVEWDLSGWQLDDVAEGGSAPWVFPGGTGVPPRGYLLLFASTTGLALNNGGDELRLISADGATADTVRYASTRPDSSIARDPDGVGPWSDSLPPSPGRANAAGAVATTTPTAAETATASVATTASPPAPTAQPGSTPGAFFPLLISEVMYDGQDSGSDAAGEWVEVHNPGAVAVPLLGWSVGDGASHDELPDVSVPAGGFLVVAAGPTPGSAMVRDGRIGNGLANKGDVVRLLSPAGEEIDALSYGSNIAAFDPSVPLAQPGASVERIPSGLDTDSALDWWSQDPPTPGRAGAVPEPVPRIVINEVMPSPRSRDWDGDGMAGFEDEWIELFNAGGQPVRLRGWSLDVGDDRWHALLGDMVIEAQGFALIWRRTSGIFLNESDSLALVRGDGVVGDRVIWDRSPGADKVWGRPDDGAAGWTDGLEPTPGMSNRLTGTAHAASVPSRPSTIREIAPLSALSGVRTGERVAVRGSVLVRPGILGRRTFYLGDATGGIRVQITADGPEPDLNEGDVVRVIGRLGSTFGEPQLRVAERDVAKESAGAPVQPVEARTGALADFLGRLVRLSGRVDGWQPNLVYVDDGSGSASVLFRTEAGIRRPWVERTQWLQAVGIVGRFARDPQEPGGYRLMPRGPSDVAAPSLLPSRLPSAGRTVAPIRDSAPRFHPPTGRLYRRSHKTGSGVE